MERTEAEHEEILDEVEAAKGKLTAATLDFEDCLRKARAAGCSLRAIAARAAVAPEKVRYLTTDMEER
jgi:uncharacterized protein (DUF111 family)